jgi:hypothetical protein
MNSASDKKIGTHKKLKLQQSHSSTGTYTGVYSTRKAKTAAIRAKLNLEQKPYLAFGKTILNLDPPPHNAICFSLRVAPLCKKRLHGQYFILTGSWALT